LRRRIAATRWPDRETVEDFSQGVQLEKLKPLVQYWGTKYDWRKAEAKLNALPQFVTTIDGVDIHFIHVRSRHPNALPLIITHGWPGSVIEQLKVIAPLTDPTAHGGSAEDAFDVVIPSLPGYGFSSKPTGTGWDPDHIARAWAELMKRLGYTRYVAQGGDWGTPISSAMARQAPAGLLGIHINLPATIPPEVVSLVRPRKRPPRSRCRLRSRYSLRTSIALQRPGPGAPIATSSTSTKSIRAGTSPRGNGRSSSRLSCAPRSGRSVKCLSLRTTRTSRSSSPPAREHREWPGLLAVHDARGRVLR